MHDDGETRQEPSEMLQYRGEACRRPALSSAAGAGMDDQNLSATIPAQALQRNPTFTDEPLPG